MEYNEKGGGAFPNQETNSDGSWSWKEGSLSWCILLDILPQKRIGVVKICCNPINICWNLHDTSMFRPWKSMVARWNFLFGMAYLFRGNLTFRECNPKHTLPITPHLCATAVITTFWAWCILHRWGCLRLFWLAVVWWPKSSRCVSCWGIVRN